MVSHQHMHRLPLLLNCRRQLSVSCASNCLVLSRRELDLADIGKVISITLRSQVLARAALQAIEEGVAPNRLLQNRGGELATARPTTRTKMRGFAEMIHHLADGMIRWKKRCEHR